MRMVVVDGDGQPSDVECGIGNMETDGAEAPTQREPTGPPPRATALKILNKGPGYVRERMLRRNAAVLRQNRKSAVELLEETKPYYVKSSMSREHRHIPTGSENCYLSDLRSRKQAGVTAASSGTTAWPTQQQAGYTSRGSCSSQLHTSKSTGSISSHTTIHRETTFPAEPGLEPEYIECVRTACKCKLPSEAKQTVVGAKRLPWQRTSTSMEFSPTPVPPLRTLVGSSDSGLGMSAQSGESGGGGGGGGGGAPVSRVAIPQVRVAAGSAGSSHSGSIEDTCTHCQQHRLGLHSCRLSHHSGHNNNIPADVMDANRLKPHDTSSPSVRPKLPGLSEWRDARTDTSSDTGDHHSNNSGVKSDDQNVVVRRRPKKSHVHRSRSDLTKRFSNSSDLSELSARFSRNSADLEKFFNEMGLDRSVLEPMLTAQCSHTSSNLHLYESASSIDSRDGGQSWCSGDNDSTKPGVTRERPVPPPEVLKGTQGQTSIVERNARIIKWLCNVKRASLEESE